MKWVWLFLFCGTGAMSLPALADDELEPAVIRDKVQSGEILSLEQILQKHPALSGQRLLDLEVELEHGRIVYELELIQPDGAVNKVLIDAGNGEIVNPEKEDDQ